MYFRRFEIEHHPSSPRTVSEFVPLIAPEIIIPARLWTDSILCICCSFMLDITTWPCSIIGLIYDLYIISNVKRSMRYLRYDNISILLPARLSSSSIWSFQERSLLRVMPKCLWDFTSFIIVLSNTTGCGSCSCLFFLFVDTPSNIPITLMLQWLAPDILDNVHTISS